MNNEITINFTPTIKQNKMFECFTDIHTTEVLYGGSAGGGKSYGISALAIIKCLEYPGIRIGLARNNLTTLKKTTIVSMMEVLGDWNLVANKHYSYNQQSGTIKFFNGSEIVLSELQYLPTDPEYTRLGGLLLTFAIIDEVGEVDEKGYNIYKTRIGRWKNKPTELNIKPLLYMTCNPTKGWLYKQFYEPYITNTLDKHKIFIPALVTDNQYLPDGYIEHLGRLPLADRERLLNGNWDYDSDPNQLMSFQDINEIYNVLGLDNGNKYITIDVAFTSDKMVVMLWDEFTIIDIYVDPKGKIEDFVYDLAKQHNIPSYRIAFDSDGVGQFLKKRLPGSKAIINNGRPINNENYRNLKTQLYYKLSEYVNSFIIKSDTDKYKEEIIEELQVIKHQPTNDVSKLQINSKADMKRTLGRSPDFADTMAYRMVFEYNKLSAPRVYSFDYTM